MHRQSPSALVMLVLVSSAIACTTAEESANETSTTPTAPATTTTTSVVLVAGSGVGNETVEFSLDTTGAVVTFTHDGSQGFTLQDLDINLEPLSLLIDTVGVYEGTRLLWQPSASGGFDITADGAWTYSVVDLTYARHEHCPIAGDGDDVVVIGELQPSNFDAGPPIPVAITFDGDTALDIFAYGFSTPEHLVATTGPYDDTLVVAGGLMIWEILANGGIWTLDRTTN